VALREVSPVSNKLNGAAVTLAEQAAAPQVLVSPRRRDRYEAWRISLCRRGNGWVCRLAMVLTRAYCAGLVVACRRKPR
jgi:hypothetical protein